MKAGIAIIGGGIIGTATAYTLSQRVHSSIILLEAENSLARHQTGHNSGVIHSGLYYKPGSFKARNCLHGRNLLYRFCQENDLPFETCGKTVIAVEPEELPRLEALQRRGEENGLMGLRLLSAEQIREIEPAASGIAGLHVPETGIIDYIRLTETMAGLFTAAGQQILTGHRLLGVRQQNRPPFRLITNGIEIEADFIINCGGLQSDRIARLCGVEPGVQIIPFRGEYYTLRPEKKDLVRHLIYPVPDPRFPFLGVHFTRRIDGWREAGPNAVLAFKREGYQKTSFSARDTLETLANPGFYRMAGKYLRMGFGEYYRSFYKAAFVRALQKLIPEITAADIIPGGAGVRAQALTRSGQLVDDFVIEQRAGQIHVLNAPSPAATASLAIAEQIAGLYQAQIS